MSLSSTQDSITAINTVRDYLRNNLTDPRVTAGGHSEDRDGKWIFTDEPRAGTKYPRIEIKKLDNPTSVIGISDNYPEQEFLLLNIWFYSKHGFSITVNGTKYENEQLVEYYQGQIKQTLKSGFNSLFDSDVKGYRHLNSSPVEKDLQGEDASNTHFGFVTIQVFYFNK